MKKVLSLLISLIFTMSTFSALAQSEVTVKFNGEEMTFDAAPFIEADRTLVPVRAIFETCKGASVNWDNDTKTVIIVYGEGDAQKFIVLQIGNNSAFVNGEAVTLDVPAKIVNDRTFVPLAFLMNELVNSVSWDGATRTVEITDK